MASRKRWRSGVFAGLAAAFVALGLYGFWYEPASLRVVAHDIRLDEAAGLLRMPLRIAVIADLHGGAPYIGEAKIEEVVALTNRAKPDLILLTGDYVTKGLIGGRPLPIETIAGKLRGLSAPLGTYAVLGNHDRAEDAPRIAAALEEAGIRVLDDRAVSLDHGGPVCSPASAISEAGRTISPVRWRMFRQASARCASPTPPTFFRACLRPAH